MGADEPSTTASSDTVTALVQLCPLCQGAVRGNRIGSITGPRSTGNERHIWSCALCVAIKEANKSRSYAIHDILRWCQRGLNGFSISTQEPQPPIGDITDIIVYSTKNKRPTISSMDGKGLHDKTDLSNISHDNVIRVVPRKEIDVSLVKDWLNSCQKHHSICEKEAQKWTQLDMELILVDVHQKKLVKATPGSRYFALSYVRGKVQQFSLKESDLVSLQRGNALAQIWSQIPNVIKHAIHFVASISEQYLWVDTLCIIHDNPKRRHTISRMNEIYGGSMCTIVAVDAADASSQLPGVFPYTRDVTHLGQNANVEIARKRADLASVCISSRYEKRAWTYQERILSTRCLFFTNEQVYFQCREAIWSEDRYEHFSQDFGNPPNPMHSELGSRSPWPTMFDSYVQLVHRYTRRRLSFAIDRLDAFSGISSTLTSDWNWTFICGSPAHLMDLMVLWISTKQAEQRVKSDNSGQYLPTWSWAGWEDGVHYRMVSATSAEPTVYQFAVTAPEGIRVFTTQRDLESAGLLIEPPNEPILDTAALEDENLVVIPPALATVHNVLIFRAETVPAEKYKLLLTTQTIFTKHFDEEPPNEAVNRITFRGGPCGILVHGRFNPEQGYRYEYVLISQTSDLPFITTLNDDFLNRDDDDVYVQNVYHEHFRRRQKPTMNIMLIKWTSEGFAERVAVGQIHEDAWKAGRPEHKKIFLG